jgi:hypothetical protein
MGISYDYFKESGHSIFAHSPSDILHPLLYPLPSREGKITPPYSSPYLRGGGVGLIFLHLRVREGEGIFETNAMSASNMQEGKDDYD